MSRCSGKTFRWVLRCLVDASEGINTVFVSNTRLHLRVAINMAHQITQDMEVVGHKRDQLHFLNAGSIYFVTEGQFGRDKRSGLRDIKIVHDN